MRVSLSMPQFGESITHAVIVRWLKKVGEAVKEGEPIVEMETEKSVFSYESPFEGTLSAIVQLDNTEVEVGGVIANFEVEEKRGAHYLSLGIGRSGPPGSGSPSSKKISPLVRALVREHGLADADADQITPSGSEGRLTKEDILNYLEIQRTASRPGVKIIPLTPIRARIAEKMVLAKQKIPHANCGIEVDVTRLVEWRGKNNKTFLDREGFSISYLPFLILSVARILPEYRIFNSALKEEGGKKWVEEYEGLNAGIAVATEAGLMVPVIKGADRKDLAQLSREMNRLGNKGKEGKLSVDELTGGTLTFNNSGALGATRSGQVIPYPQVAILAMNRIVRRPWVVNDKGQETIAIRSIVDLDLAFDHRLIDGDRAVRFLVAIREQLENFESKKINLT